MIKVQYDRTYYVPANFILEASGGVQYKVEQAYTASSTVDVADDHLQLDGPQVDESYYFLLPVVAVNNGTEGIIDAGTALDALSSFDGYIAAEAYGTFTGGVDAETVDDVITRLPAAISHRSLESRKSIEAILRSPEGGNFDAQLQAVSVRGYGDADQLRDKHNAHGVAMGGKADLYVRTFGRPTTVVLQKTGTLIAPNTYQITIGVDDAPGFYAVRAVTDANDIVSPTLDFRTLPALGSYPILDTRGMSGTQATIHDIDESNGLIETAFTVYQTSVLTVTNVITGTADTHEFRVELYVAPDLAAIQTYVDRDDVRNLKADYLVRCPLLCLVGLRATVVPEQGATLDVPAMQQALADYINSRNFEATLTESELLGVLHQFQIARVNTSDDQIVGFSLQGIIRDASGALHTLQGHALDIANIADPAVLLTPQTCVFAAHADDIYITVRAT